MRNWLKSSSKHQKALSPGSHFGQPLFVARAAPNFAHPSQNAYLSFPLWQAEIYFSSLTPWALGTSGSKSKKREIF
jgi:hypothetical protein